MRTARGEDTMPGDGNLFFDVSFDPDADDGDGLFHYVGEVEEEELTALQELPSRTGFFEDFSTEVLDGSPNTIEPRSPAEINILSDFDADVEDSVTMDEGSSLESSCPDLLGVDDEGGESISDEEREEDLNLESSSLADDGNWLLEEFQEYLSMQDTQGIPFTTQYGESCYEDENRSLQYFIDNEDWDALATAVEEAPELSRGEIHLVCQGISLRALPLHGVVARRIVPWDAMDSLLTAYSLALQKGDSFDGRLPLHMALLNGASGSIVRDLSSACTETLKRPDKQGNIALHYACQYSREEVVQTVLEALPAATRHLNRKRQLPLHLLCARCWHDPEMILSLEIIKQVLKCHPKALSVSDRNGRLPLHMACNQFQPRFDVLKLFAKAYPAALVHRDHSNKTPSELCKKLLTNSSDVNDQDENPVLSYLRERTLQERRRMKSIGRLFPKPAESSRSPEHKKTIQAFYNFMDNEEL